MVCVVAGTTCLTFAIASPAPSRMASAAVAIAVATDFKGSVAACAGCALAVDMELLDDFKMQTQGRNSEHKIRPTILPDADCRSIKIFRLKSSTHRHSSILHNSACRTPKV